MSIRGTVNTVWRDRLADSCAGRSYERTRRVNYHGMNIAAVIMAASILAGCTNPDGTANRSGTGAIIGGLTGVAAGQIAGAEPVRP
jgi:hypothetical protein